MSAIKSGLFVSIGLLVGLAAMGDTASEPKVTVKEVMEAVITPATNMLWSAEDPQTDERWQELENAAIATITAGNYVASGGSGANDNEWARKPEWQAFNTVMIEAATGALKAIRNRDIEALFVANDVLYPPCEGCHIAFNPGVQ